MLRHRDDNCINIFCGKPLTDFEKKRQGRSYKMRFCRYCRTYRHKNGSSKCAWKCIGCEKILDYNSVEFTGQYWCTKGDELCPTQLNQRREHQNKLFKTKTVARRLVSKGYTLPTVD